ncbi:MAG: CBS domain-containing protein, partial [Anaerolineae bacterium]
VGVLTRSEIDRAVHHGLLSSPVESLMHKGDISVGPNDSVEHLQEVMMQNGLGQVPVVDGGEIQGIVTRTDLIKLWSAPPQPTGVPEIRSLLAEALPPDLESFLRKAGRVAKRRGHNLYLVGGFVRDLLLGVPNLDIDLVVEGDAIQLAEAMAQVAGGRVHGHPPFGTAKLIWEGDSPIAPLRSLDFVTARTEFYEHPTALPQVERSAIKQDLHRRDFTINTLAISLEEDRYGELLDFYGGEADLARGLIRVLHNLSLVEDPTRILRAVRLEKRLGFRIEERTEELIGGALEFLDRVSGERIRQELEAIFSEEDPTAPLARLQELAVLTRIHPAMRLDPERSLWIAGLRERWRSWTEMDCRGGTGGPLPRYLYLGILALGASPEQADGIGVRLGLRVGERQVLRDAEQLRRSSHTLTTEGLGPAQLRDRLDDYRRKALFLVWATASPSDALARRLAGYHGDLACVSAELTGEDLKSLGIPPGPVFREILKALRDARLDGSVRTRKEELELARRLATAREGGSSPAGSGAAGPA